MFKSRQEAKPFDINSVPIGLEEFNKWTEEVIALTRLPLNESMRFAVASIVLEEKDLITKQDCAKRLVKAAQNQLAAFVFQDIKTKRIAADEAAKKATEEQGDGLQNTSEEVVPQA